MQIVFVGNCQVQMLAAILRRFVSPYIQLKLDFIDTYQPVTDALRAIVANADVIVAQESLTPPPSFVDLATAAHAEIHKVPSVNGSFLYPHQGLPHPLKPIARYGNPPYPNEYNDRFLSKLILSGTPPEDALSLYQNHDVARSGRVERLYELAREGQRQLDSRTGYDCADIIDSHLQQEQLFQSAFHYSERLARHIAATLCDRIGFEPKFGQRIRDHLLEAPFMARFAPVHPSVARHFDMKWVNETTRYEYMWEGSFTFDEYVIRYMGAVWNQTLQEGVIDAQRGDQSARAKLEAGLVNSPHSALGLHELSRILEREGDVETAINLQRRAAASGTAAIFFVRLGRLLQSSGSLAGAKDAFAKATRLDPVSPAAWALLRDVLSAMGEFAEARLAAGEAAKFDVNPAGAERALARLTERVKSAHAT